MLKKTIFRIKHGMYSMINGDAKITNNTEITTAQNVSSATDK
jgi:hypothetical protein